MIKNVLVTGGAGYVGAVLVPKLLKLGYKVSVIDWYLFGEQVILNHPRLKQIKGDIRDKKLLGSELKVNDAVIHLACISNDPSFELDPNLGKDINYEATIQLVDLAKQNGVKRFIYASTSSVYGVKREKEVTEDLSLAPLTDYSRYKGLCEQYIKKQNSNRFTVLILRPATVCGYSPRLRLDLTVNMLTIQALVNKRITVFGGSQKRPNIHIEDMAEIYIRSLQYFATKVRGKIYNVGYENYTLLEIAKMIKKTLGDPNIEIVISPTNDKRSYHISSKKIEKELRFIPKYSVEEAILGLKKAYEGGKIPNPLQDSRYYNVKTMKKTSPQYPLSY